MVRAYRPDGAADLLHARHALERLFHRTITQLLDNMSDSNLEWSEPPSTC